MATQRVNVTTALKIMVENGTTDSGTIKYAARTISSINPDLSDDDMLAIGQGLAAMQSNEVGDIKRSDIATLVAGA